VKDEFGKQGICPNCGSDDLEYHDTEFDEVDRELIIEPWNCLNCDVYGKELYDLDKFISNTITEE